MAERSASEIFDALKNLIWEKKRDPLSDLNLEETESSFVRGLKSAYASGTDTLRELLKDVLEGRQIDETSGMLARARIPTSDKQKIDEFIESLVKYSSIVKELSDKLSEAKSTVDDVRAEKIGESIKFLIEDFDTLKKRGGKNFSELLSMIEKSLSFYAIPPLGGKNFFGVDPNLLSKFFYIANLEENRYREAAFLLTRKDYFEKPEEYTALFGASVPITALTKQLGDTLSTFSTATKLLEESSRTTRLFDPNIPFVRELQRDRLSRLPGEFAYARRFLSASLEETEKKIAELESIPQEKRDYETLAKYVSERQVLQEKLLELTKQEISIREELQRKTTGLLLEATKALSEKFFDRAFSLTRNPFVDIFTDSLKFGFQIGSLVYSGTRNILSFGTRPLVIPTQPPSTGRSPIPTPIPKKPEPPTQQPPSSPTPTPTPTPKSPSTSTPTPTSTTSTPSSASKTTTGPTQTSISTAIPTYSRTTPTTTASPIRNITTTPISAPTSQTTTQAPVLINRSFTPISRPLVQTTTIEPPSPNASQVINSLLQNLPSKSSNQVQSVPKEALTQIVKQTETNITTSTPPKLPNVTASIPPQLPNTTTSISPQLPNTTTSIPPQLPNTTTSIPPQLLSKTPLQTSTSNTKIPEQYTTQTPGRTFTAQTTTYDINKTLQTPEKTYIPQSTSISAKITDQAFERPLIPQQTSMTIPSKGQTLHQPTLTPKTIQFPTFQTIQIPTLQAPTPQIIQTPTSQKTAFTKILIPEQSQVFPQAPVALQRQPAGLLQGIFNQNSTQATPSTPSPILQYQTPTPQISNTQTTPIPKTLYQTQTQVQGTTTQTQTRPQSRLVDSTISIPNISNILKYGGISFAISLAPSIYESIVNKKPLSETITSEKLGSALLGTAGSVLGSMLVPIPGLNLISSFALGTFGSQLGARLFSRKEENQQTQQQQQQKTTENVIGLGELNKRLAQASLGFEDLISQTNKFSLGLIGATAGLSGFSSGLPSISNFLKNINKNELLIEGTSMLAGLGAGTLAFITDFYLSSLNKGFDIYYQQFVQQGILPQFVRRQLGRSTAEISANLITPGTGLLYQGPYSVAGLGFERTELLAATSRMAASYVISSSEDLADSLKKSANMARVFGVSLGESVNTFGLLKRSLMDYNDIFKASFAATGTTNYSAFTKQLAEAIISASTSLSLRQGVRPSDYFQSFAILQGVFLNSQNSALRELARNNMEIVQNTLSTLNEFIRGGLSNPVAGGMSIRAGLTPLEILQGVKQENLVRVLRQMVIELGLPGSFLGGQFTSQATNYLIPLIQQTLGLQNINPEAFREVLGAIIMGREEDALRKLEKVSPIRGIAPDETFAKNIDELNKSYQMLTKALGENTRAIVDLNVGVNNLTARILSIGDSVLSFVLGSISDAIKDFSKYPGLKPEDYIKPKDKGPSGGGGIGLKTETPQTSYQMSTSQGTYLIIKNPTIVREEEFVDFVRKIYEIENKKR